VSEPPTPDPRSLAAFLPVMDAQDFDFGHWETPGSDASGVLRMPYYSVGPGGMAFLRALGVGNWVTPAVDWRTWAETEEAARLMSDPASVGAASAAQLQRLLTMIVRGDRFNEGMLANAYESGLLRRIVRRAIEIAGHRL
jgi:Family of unknown function (DUF6508)